ncbi:sodium/hydrogen exchanger 9-like isoform X2 [Zophobas morio]|uniref:sodium/hydrogen exchanger 9-like isoform X2 n=1 Tax=Zophobas morio TaxID=2755281 RepID=UPI0030834BE5
MTNFVGSLSIGMFIALLTALGSKYSDLSRYPLLETALLLLMSYSSFLLAETFSLSGIVGILFCGIGQAHYTSFNLSPQGDWQNQLSQFSELLNFMAENFVFVYLGISLFTFPGQLWNFGFITLCLLFSLLSRAVNVFPISYISNLTFLRNKKIPLKFQFMMWFAGLRGAVAFFLAMKNTSTEGKRVIGLTTLVIVISTALVLGGATVPVLDFLKIKHSKAAIAEETDFYSIADQGDASMTVVSHGRLAYWWLKFDESCMKPVFLRRQQKTENLELDVQLRTGDSASSDSINDPQALEELERDDVFA